MTDFSSQSIQPVTISQSGHSSITGHRKNLYSEPGRKHSLETIDRFSSCRFHSDANNIAFHGLQDILSRTDTTSMEKSLARLGVDLRTSRDDKASLAIRKAVLQTIASQTPGPAGSVICNLISDIINPSGDKAFINQGLKAGFNAILKNSETTPGEKFFAKFGQDIGVVLDTSDSSAIRSIVMEHIARGVEKPYTAALASMILDTVSSGKLSRKASSHMMLSGFWKIKDDPKASATERSMADFGIPAGRMGSEPAESLHLCKKILEKIINPGYEEERYVTAKFMLETSNDPEISDKLSEELIQEGLKRLSENPSSTDIEKRIADFGIEAGKSCDTSEASPCHRKVLEKIISKPPGNLPRILSGLACEMVEIPGLSPSTSGKILFEACRTICEDENTATEVKNSAQEGMGYKTDGSSTGVVLDIMRKIHTLTEESEEETRRQILEKLLESGGNSEKKIQDQESVPVTYTETSVDLGGVELKKRKKRF